MTTLASTTRSEWTKFRSLRSNIVMIGLSLLLGLGLTALLAFADGATHDHWTSSQWHDFSPISSAFSGSVLGVIILVVLGVMVGSSEYSSGMIRLTLTATPRRGRVLVAKATVVAAVTAVVGLALSVGQFLIAQAVYASYDLPTASLSDRTALRAVLITGVLTPVLPLIGLMVGSALRSTAGGITTILAFVFVPTMFSGLLPKWWKEHVLCYLPDPSSSSLALGRLADTTVTTWAAATALI